MSDTDQGTRWSNPLAPPPGRTIAPSPLPFQDPRMNQRQQGMRSTAAQYVPTANQPGFMNRPMTDVGNPYDIQSALPNANEIPGIMHAMTMGLGRYGSPQVAQNAIGMGKAMMGVTEAYAKGQHDRMANDKLAMENHVYQLQQAIASQLRDYQEAYHLYGPEVDGEGNVKNPGEAEKFHSTLEGFARKHNDQTLLTAIHDKDWKAVDQYIHWLDGHNETLKDIEERLRIDVLKGQIQKQKEEEADRARARNPPDPNVEGKPGRPDTGGRPGDPAPAEPATPSPSPSPATPPPFPAPLPPGMGGGSSEATPDQTNQPVQLAQADTGTMSDAPQPGAQRLAQADQIDPQTGRPYPIQIHPVVPPSTENQPQVQRQGTNLPSWVTPVTPAGRAYGNAGVTPPPQQVQTSQQPWKVTPVETGTRGEDLTVSTPEERNAIPDDDPSYKAPKLIPLPPARDYSQVPGVNLSQSDVDTLADTYMKTGRSPFVGIAGVRGQYNQEKNNIVINRANEKREFVRRAIKSIGPHHPEAALAAIENAMPGAAAVVRSIVRGARPIPQGYAATSIYWNAIQEVATQIKPNLSAADYQVYLRTMLALKNGTSYPSQTILASDRALSHVMYAMELYGDLHQNDSPLRLSNAARNWLRTQFGDDRPGNFNIVMSHVAQELTKVFRANGGTLHEVERELQAISSTSSADQVAGYGRAIAHLMYGQLEAINEMAVRGTGIHTHPLDWLSPEAQANFTKLRAMKSNFFPFMATDGYYAADPALTQRQQDALSKTYSWELAPGITITDPGSSYYQPPDPNSAAMTPPVWPGPSGEPGDTNVFMGPQQ